MALTLTFGLSQLVQHAWRCTKSARDALVRLLSDSNTSAPTARLEADWPLHIPDRLPSKILSGHIGLQSANTTWPAWILTKGVVEDAIAACKEEDNLARMEHVFEKLLTTLLERDSTMREKILEAREDIQKLECAIGDRGSEHESWTSKDRRNVEMLEGLKDELGRTQDLRRHCDRERLVYSEALLQRYRSTNEVQNWLIRDLKTYLSGKGLLQFESQQFVRDWQHLPASFRNETLLQRKLENLQAGDLEHSDPPELFGRDEASRYSAYIDYEIAKVDVAAAFEDLVNLEQGLEKRERIRANEELEGEMVPTP